MQDPNLLYHVNTARNELIAAVHRARAIGNVIAAHELTAALERVSSLTRRDTQEGTAPADASASADHDAP
jgi:hypothetical protein